MAQDLPFRSIPEAPPQMTAENLLVRMIQGLGFRYYWATEGLRTEDLAYKPSATGQSSRETLEHLYGLTEVILNTSKNKPSVRPVPSIPEDFETLRSKTLHQLQDAVINFQSIKTEDLAMQKVIFDRGGKRSEFPLWNLINGPISDALYHTGQVVSFRRSSGNPIPKGVNVFLGLKN
ncbi:hypothetical protein N9I15_01000 [Flavobacteriaceae bacterium]|jgi:uncharacterized damage-inducible protein DinB|nr:hypothetical protein [Flavobacteriaceae bacterium]MDA9587723.1 hypothetical protein [Flavobacteriaceae bacterium]MDC0386040.1 hypothetical protein [Flavobacteriaceae bacterium]